MKEELKRYLSKIKNLSKKRTAIIAMVAIVIISASGLGIYFLAGAESTPINEKASIDRSDQVAEDNINTDIEDETSSSKANDATSSSKEWSAADVKCSICGERISDSSKEHLGFGPGDTTTTHGECLAKQLYGEDVFDRCLWCDKVVTDGYHVVKHIPWAYGDRIAHDYCWFEYCSVCGKQVERNFNSDTFELPMKDGMCYDCYNASQINEAPSEEPPNVTCPACGYSWFTTGVGIEGFFCPECGVNFNGNGQIIG